MKLYALLLLSVFICGCGFKTPPPTPEELRAKIAGSCINESDSYTNSKGARLDFQFNPAGIDPIFGAPATAKLIARGGTPSSYAISIAYNADNWDFLDKANEKGGKELKLEGINKDPNRPTHVLDSALIPLSAEQLARYSIEGLDFKVSAQRGEAAFVIPSFAFKELLTCASVSGIN